MDKLNILGTEYHVYDDERVVEDAGAYGVCRFLSKQIFLHPEDDILEDGTPEENQTHYNKVMRHEIIHAAFYESGLTQYTNDETLVEWLAVQFPKLAAIFEKADCST